MTAYTIADERIQALFWERVAKLDDPDACWVWTGSKLKEPGNYGMFFFDRNRIVAHRASWWIAHGAMPPKELCVCHSCDNPPCVNPNHLWLGTHGDNARDCASKGRNWFQKHPELVTRGNDHWSRRRPEARSRGPKNGKSKLTEEQVIEIAAYSEPHDATAAKYGISRVTVQKIRLGKLWGYLTESVRRNAKKWTPLQSGRFSGKRATAARTGRLRLHSCD